MKRKIFIFILLVVLASKITGCQIAIDEPHDNGAPSYFLEPEGYIIAKIYTNKVLVSKYGYILEEDYQKYLNGCVEGILVVKHPYEQNKETSVPYREITSITIGEYEDYRY